MGKNRHNQTGFAKAVIQKGFTLLELIVAMAIIAILAAVAVPAYTEYTVQSRLTEAFTTLATSAASAEQFWTNNRTYVGFDDPAKSKAWVASTTNFTYTLSNATDSTYTITAVGRNSAANFQFTVNQDGAKTTNSVKSNWSGAGSACWVYKKDGTCVQ